MFRLISLMSLMIMTAVLGVGVTMYAIQNSSQGAHGAIGSHLKAPERVDKPLVTVQASEERQGPESEAAEQER